MASSRQRKRKAGLMRIDAALDSLCLMGFSRVLVRKTVNRLLKAYGGDEGWVFLEEASYKVVIDAILEEQDSQEKAELENAPPKLLEGPSLKVDSDYETQSQSLDAQSLQGDNSPGINQSTLLDVTEQSQPLQTKVTAEILPLSRHIKSKPPRDNDNSHHHLEDILEEDEATIKGNCKEPIVTTNVKPLLIVADDDVKPALISHRSIKELGSSPVAKRRRPCFGWISDDDIDENDIVYLMPSSAKVFKF